MQKHFIAQWALGTALLCSLMSCSQKDISTGNLNVIPLPQEITEYTQDSPFVIDSSTKICYPADNEKLQRTAHFLASYIKEITGTEVGLTTQSGKNCIILSVDSTIPHQDGYELLINSSQIQVKGATEAGVFTASRLSTKPFLLLREKP